MPKSASLALIQRTIIKDAYEKTGRPYLVNSRPYESTLPVKFDVVAAKTNDGTATGSSTGFLVARAGQVLEWFGYGRSANGNQGPSVGALDDDTSIVKARNTNASEDFVIEGVSLTHRSTRWIFSDADNIGLRSGIGAVLDADIDAAFGFGQGTNMIANQQVLFDPTSLYTPIVTQNPVMLEDALLTAILPHMFLEFVWGGKRTEPIGCLDNVPEGGAKSLLRASGLPATGDDYRMRVPEGYLWRKSGADEDFIARGRLARAICIPFASVIWPSEAVGTVGHSPISVWMDLKIRLHGVAFGFPSRN